MATTDYFQRLSLAGDYSDLTKPDLLTRYAGGHNRKNHIYVSGYWQFMIWVPPVIFGDDKQEAETWMHATAEGFTPHSRSINKVDIPGQGGTGASFIAGQAISRTFSVSFREYQRLPILSILAKWSAIDPYIGVSPIPGNQWYAGAYKGAAMAVLTKPTGGNRGSSMTVDDIEEVFYYSGVMPETPGIDSLATDISASDTVTHQVSFSFDGYPLTRREIDLQMVIDTLLSSSYYQTTYLGTYANDAKVPANITLK